MVWEWVGGGHSDNKADRAGLDEKVTSEQACEQDEEVNQQRLEEECSKQWSTVHSKCKGPGAE